MAGEKDVCVSVRNVSKKFARSLKRSFVYGAQDIVRIATGRPLNPALRESEFWALREVSFDLEKGQAMGIVGLNGSGKTTLLRIIAGILRPTTGQANVTGRIAPMLALGAGFKPALSGRENIFLNMSILGLTHADIKREYDAVVDFAELHEAIEAPLGTYSTGMLMRLGFACAVHTSPEILIVDEVLAVGDAPFRIKCRNKFNELRRNGAAMLLVSHSASSVGALTNNSLYLKRGNVAAFGKSDEVIKAYEADTIRGAAVANAKSITSAKETAAPRARKTSSSVIIRSVRLDIPGVADAGHWKSGEPGLLTIDIAADRRVEDLNVVLIFADIGAGAPQNVQYITAVGDIGALRLDGREATVKVAFSPVTFRPGIYNLKVALSSGELHDLLDLIDNIKVVVSDPGKNSHCLFYQPREWTMNGATVVELSKMNDDMADAESGEGF